MRTARTSVAFVVTGALLAGCATSHTELTVRAPGLLGEAQLSGLTTWNGMLILVPQVEPRIYWVPLSAIALAVEADAEFGLLLEAEWLSGSLPPLGGRAGWEAVAVGRYGDVDTLVLAYEASDGRHALYAAPVSVTKQGLHLGTLRRLTGLVATSNPNHAYEALLALDADAWLALPEFDVDDAVRVRRGRSVPRVARVDVAAHPFRLSDAASLSGNGTRALATSFCWRGDKPRCTAGGDASALHVLCLDLEGEAITVVDALPLPVSTPGGDGEYNAEGLALHGGGLVLVNDNLPGGSTTTLRFDDSPEVRAFIAACVDAFD